MMSKIFQPGQKIVSVEEAKFAAAIWREEKKSGKKRVLVMMVGLQVTVVSLLILLLMGRQVDTGMPAGQRLGAGEKEDGRSEVMSAKERRDLTSKSVFDKIKPDVSERIKTRNAVKENGNNFLKNIGAETEFQKNVEAEKKTELLRFGKRGWMLLTPSKVSLLVIARFNFDSVHQNLFFLFRKMRQKENSVLKKRWAVNIFRDILRRISIKYMYTRMH